MSKLIGKIDYSKHISRRYTILCGLGSLIDGLITILTFGCIGSSFNFKLCLFSARRKQK